MAKSPDIITTIGIGSCVVIVLYDNIHKIGGLAHVLLPSSLNCCDDSSPYLYADTAIIKLQQDMKKQGASRSFYSAKLIGGARMFSSHPEIPSIGDMNLESIRHLLLKEDIPVISEDTGGVVGRTVKFHLDDGEVVVKRTYGNIIRL